MHTLHTSLRLPSLTRRAVLLAGAALPALGLAQSFPAKPIRIVVPFGPGGIADDSEQRVQMRLSAVQRVQALGNHEINLEIAGQVASVGKLLDLPTARIYPVSAQKALVGKIQMVASDAAVVRRDAVAMAAASRIMAGCQTTPTGRCRAAVPRE